MPPIQDDAPEQPLAHAHDRAPGGPVPADHVDRRSYIRVFVKVNQENSLTVVRADGQTAAVRLVDISIGGARIALADMDQSSADASFFAGVEHVTFKNCRQEPFGEQLEGKQAQVMWEREGQAGLLFETLMG